MIIANLLALQCLINPYRKRLKPRDEVLIPSLCWSTSMAHYSIWFKTKFVDIDLETLNINLNDLKKDFKKTKVTIIVHVLGNRYY